MRRVVAACALAIAACGRVHFDGLDDGGPSGSDAAPTFSTPVMVLADSTKLITNPTVREGELEMFVVLRTNTGVQRDSRRVSDTAARHRARDE